MATLIGTLYVPQGVKMAHFIGAFYALLTASVSETPTILWQYGYVIVAGTLPLFWIDLGKDEPGMTLQREYREGGRLIWRDCCH